MKKSNKKNVLITFVCAILSMIFICGICVVGYYFLKPETNVIEGEQYYKGRNAYFEEAEDYCSHLLVFPSSDVDMNIQNYYYEKTFTIFLSSYDIYLEYSLDEEAYQKEKQRIENIAMQYKGIEQKAVNIENVSSYTVYVTSWIEERAYEYALLDDDNKKIVCVYSQLHEPKTAVIPAKYMLDINAANTALAEKFSIYYFKGSGNELILPQLSGDEIKSTWFPNK